MTAIVGEYPREPERAEAPQPTLAGAAVRRGEALRAARALRGWTQGELCRRAGLPRDRVMRIERGYVRKVRHDAQHRLLRALELPVSLGEVGR